MAGGRTIDLDLPPDERPPVYNQRRAPFLFLELDQRAHLPQRIHQRRDRSLMQPTSPPKTVSARRRRTQRREETQHAARLTAVDVRIRSRQVAPAPRDFHSVFGSISLQSDAQGLQPGEQALSVVGKQGI